MIAANGAGAGGGGDTRESAVAYHRVRLVRVDDRRGASVRADGRLLVQMAACRPCPHRRCPRTPRPIVGQRAEAAPRRPAVVYVE